MKKLVLFVIFIMACGISRADELILGDLLNKIPSVKQGVAFSLPDGKFNYLATIDAVQWKGLNLEVGYAGRAKETADKAVAVLSYDLLKLKDVVDMPILDLIEFRPGIYAGFGRIEGFEDGRLACEDDYGVSLSVIDVKF